MKVLVTGGVEYMSSRACEGGWANGRSRKALNWCAFKAG